MNSLKKAPRRGIAAGVAGLLVAGAASVLVAPAAQAAPSMELNWNVSTQFVNHLASRTTADGAAFDAIAQSFSFPATNVSTDGSGTTTTSFAGSVTGAFLNPSTSAFLYSVTVASPEVIVESDGDGKIVATVSSLGSNTNPAVVMGGSKVTVAEFSGATTVEGVTTATPNWEGVLAPGSQTAIDLGITNPARPVDGKSFHPDFMGQIHGDIRAHFHFTTSSDAKRPGDIEIVAAQPKITPTVTAASYEDGVTIKVDGQGFTAVTNPGDAGVYVALAPADTVINYADQSSMSTMASVDYVTPGRFNADKFIAQLVAPTAKLDPTKSYAIFTWQAHTHSNTSQDTKTPVAIDWTKLTAPVVTPPIVTPPIIEAPAVVKVNSSVNFKLNKATRKKAGKATVTIKGGAVVATGTAKVTVKVPGVKKAKNSTVTLNAKGKAVVKLPKARKKGQYKIVVKYTGDVKLNAAKKAVKKFKVA